MIAGASMKLTMVLFIITGQAAQLICMLNSNTTGYLYNTLGIDQVVQEWNSQHTVAQVHAL